MSLAAVGLGVAASCCWGVSNLLGGVKARGILAVGSRPRDLPVLPMLAVTQPTGLAVITGVTLLAGEQPAPVGHLCLAAVAGTLTIVALNALYSGMTMSSVGVVAPVAAMGILVPIAWGAAHGDHPGSVQWCGVLVAATGVVLVSRRGRHA